MKTYIKTKDRIFLSNTCETCNGAGEYSPRNPWDDGNTCDDCCGSGMGSGQIDLCPGERAEVIDDEGNLHDIKGVALTAQFKVIELSGKRYGQFIGMGCEEFIRLQPK